MAKDASFDVVSEIDLQELRNAVDQAKREVSTRFDFKDTGADIDMAQEGEKVTLTVRANTEQKVKDSVRVLEEKLVKRKIAIKVLDFGKIEAAAGGTARQTIGIKQGIPTDKAKEIVKHIKDRKHKAQSSIQGDQVRISSKSLDTLQAIQGELREKDFGLPLQFVNYRS